MTEAHPLTLTGAQVRLFIDGGYFLENLAALPAARVAAACRRCHGVGRVTPLVGEQRVLVHCDCRQGAVKLDQPLDLTPLLEALDWDLACTHCGAALRGDNDPAASVFTVGCPCTHREYRLPVA